MTAATLAAAATAASSQTVLFSESEFDPNDWTATPSFLFGAVQPGQTQSVSTARFTAGNPANSFLVQQHMLDSPFNSSVAPVLMNDWTYDPSSEGAIESISFSMRTINVSDLSPAFGTPRVFLMQDGRLYISSQVGGSFFGFGFDEQTQIRNFSGAVETNFIEIMPNAGIDLNSHPDFNGSTIHFGFGTTLTPTDLGGQGLVTRAIGIDDVSFRIQTVPTPGVAAAGLAGLVLTRRRRA
ncbi:MAG: hypothetical protein AAFU70_05200 [Planctomycetota bacterium]